MEAAEAKRVWKNKRRASLYNLRDSIGFMYRVDKSLKLGTETQQQENIEPQISSVKNDSKNFVLHASSTEHCSNTVLPLKSPAVSDPALKTPAVSDTALKTPAVSDPALKTPAVSDSALKTPAVSDSALKTPAVSDSALKSPAVSDPALKSPAVSNLALKSPAMSDQILKTPAVSDSALKSPAVSDPTIDAVPLADQSMREMSSLSSEEMLKKEMFIKSDCGTFIQNLKTELMSSVVAGKEQEFDAVMDSLLEELTQSDLYRAALEYPEVMTHPLQESCSQIILRMKQLIHKYDVEIQEWDALMKFKRDQVREKALTEPVMERQEVEAHLTNEEHHMLRHDPLVNWHYTEDKEKELVQLNAKLDAQLQRIITDSDMIRKQLGESQEQLATAIQPEETPRSLVQSLKRTLD